MNSNNYVIINNRAYDPVTGLPVDGVNIQPTIEPAAEPAKTKPAAIRGVATPIMHRPLEHSATLSRRYVKKPTVISPLQAEAEANAPQYSPMTLNQLTTKKAEPIQKFTPKKSAVTKARADRPAERHPMTHRATGRTLDVMAPRRQRANIHKKLDIQAKLAPVAAKPTVKKELKPAHVLKNEAIYAAMNKEVTEKKSRRTKTKKTNRWARFTTLAGASLAVIMLAGYFTYLNMPNLSIKMAAVQSGVNAKYPGYRPDGYALSGPISFKNGEVSMQFAYAGGDKDFTIKQEKSSWDSSAVKQYVDKKSQDITTTVANGLTIYTYGSNAAWVNGGVLYTLEGDAPLSSDQIQRIATSM